MYYTDRLQNRNQEGGDAEAFTADIVRIYEMLSTMAGGYDGGMTAGLLNITARKCRSSASGLPAVLDSGRPVSLNHYS